MTDIILYRTPDGLAEIQLRAQDGSVWLTQAEIAELFNVTPQNVTLHLRSIYEQGELQEEATCKEYLQVRQEGGRAVERQLKHYNLEVILSVGYRISSPRGVQFRQWATTALKEYLVKGFVINDERLKNPGGFDYFDELLERIREIRASEKRFYQKVKDIFSLSSDYDPKSDQAITFFKTIQNKMLWAVNGQTAAELIIARADPKKPNMGLMSWQGSRVRKTDVATAKNYLKEPEIHALNLLVTAFLDLAQSRAEQRQQTIMAEWLSFTDNFLKLAERKVLTNAGSVSHERMMTIVEERFTQFDDARREAERAQAETEHEAEVTAELKQIEKRVEQAKSEKKPSHRKKTGRK